MRESWDSYFVRIAYEVATRGTCDRKHVGCAIARDNRLLVTGYNGAISGMPHCDDIRHHIHDGGCIRAVHAEINALMQAARNGVRIDGATSYATMYPCWPCFRALVQSGVKRFVYAEPYRTNTGSGHVEGQKCIDDVVRTLGIEMVHVERKVSP